MESTPVMPAVLTQIFPQDPNALLDDLRSRMNEDHLLVIAKADYETDVEKHLATLLPILRNGDISQVTKWHPLEVLELTRWSEPEDPGWPANDGHLIRAFCCTVVLRVAVALPNYEEDLNQTLAQLVTSTDALETILQYKYGQLLTWMMPQLPIYEERPFVAFTLGCLAVRFYPPSASEVELADIPAWIVEEEIKHRTSGYYTKPGGYHSLWLLGTTYYSQRHHLWQQIAAGLARDAFRLQDREVRQAFLDLAAKVTNLPPWRSVE